ncbi:MAG: hypothetical protein GFH27_549279n498 [Chloroflexi bacterium AL-W]|nr:hypothetical protein [Chloroflexi bacterium AL-N1]NOK65463.1 hypothetical protein [Chloroflexi bacterium AL-N10]NOK72271.1 hypothetical protein [Chloroflexi bacterium AL-N5]NOK79643.1 hypothetical protein [Chloroflexi bacterium AL-W]NOK87558.1 hypothetical protein [Chloroflexi bacterium AL-N15]
MIHYTDDRRFAVYPFTQQHEEEEIIISRADTASVLILPTDGVEILDCLAEGMSIGELNTYYHDKYDVTPDLDDFLKTVEDAGFILPLEPDQRVDASTVKDLFTNGTAGQVPSPQFHFDNFPESLARQLFSKYTFAICFIIFGITGIAIVLEPSIVPGWQSLVFTEHITLMNLSLMLIGFVGVGLHEMAHLIAARSLGISSRFGIGHRMWVIVAETDMTGVWILPRNKRYIPFLAGPLLDLTIASVLLILLFTVQSGWMTLPETALLIIRALIFGYLLGLLWQCYFFLRTDFYYVIANYFGCKNLMEDAINLLKNYSAKVLPWVQPTDQSHIPLQERKVIGIYAWVWLVGRIVALSVFVLVIIPLLYTYVVIIGQTLLAGYQANPYGFIDVVMIGAIVLSWQGVGIFLWIRSLYQSWRQTHVHTNKTSNTTSLRESNHSGG